VERLKELTMEIKIEQENTEAKLRNFQSFLREALASAKNSKDPSEIKRHENRIKDLKAKIKSDEESLSNLTDEIELNKKIFYVYNYNKLNGERLNQKFVKEKINKSKKHEINKLKNELNKLSDLVSRYKMNIENNYNKLLVNLKSIDGVSKKTIALWRILNFKDVFNTGHISSAMKDGINSTRRYLKSKSSSNGHSIDQYNILKELIQVLEKIQNNKMEILSTVSAQELLEPLYSKLKEQEKSVKEKEIIDDSLLMLEEINKDIKFIHDDKFYRFNDLNERREEIFGDDYLHDDHDALEEKLLKFKSEAIKLGLDVTDGDVVKTYTKLVSVGNESWQLVHKTEEEFLKERDAVNNKIEILKSDITKNRGYLIGIENKLEEIKNRPESKYKNHVSQIEMLLNYTGNLISKLHSYTDYSDKLYNKQKIDSDDFVKYSSLLGRYIAKKLKSILHVDKEYILKSVDIPNESFEAQDGKIIRFNDMGTGQSQSAYLMSKLNSYSGKKIVALFDEIAMMDSNSLDPIYKKINKMYKDNQLLAAVLVQKADKIKVSSLEDNYGEIRYS
jgi:exonuclease SbcC